MKKNSVFWAIIIILMMNTVLLLIVMGLIVTMLSETGKTDRTVTEQNEIHENSEYDESTNHIDDEDIIAIFENDSDDEAVTIKKSPKWKKDCPAIDSERTLEENAAIKSSYEETMQRLEKAEEIVENSEYDLSQMKITVIGDSLTEGVGLGENEKAEYNWPERLHQILKCKEVVNRGIAGSTIENLKVHDPMCERWKEEIDDDSDVIIVMGGTNDTQNQDFYAFGSIEDKEENTFCGDLDRMLREMRERFQTEDHYCKLIFINPPLSGIAVAYHNMKPDEYLEQKAFAEAINHIAISEGFEVIDLYNNNILNSNEMDVYQNLYNEDGLHLNRDGYEFLAYYVASKIIEDLE